MGEVVRSLSQSDRLLCPNVSTMPISSAHALLVRVLDAFDNAAEKDDDGEFTVDAVGKAYHAAAYGPSTSDYMDLYRHGVVVDQHGNMVKVETWWWRCHVCGLVLPAQRWRESGHG